MADKKFTEKVGLDGLLDFDPVNGILKYGSYEVFASEVGVKPERAELSYGDYLRDTTPFIGTAATVMNPVGKDRMQEFEAAVRDGTYTGKQVLPDYLAGIQSKPTGIRNVQRLGPDSFAVDTYHIPQDVEFINTIGARAAGLKYGGDDAALKQNQSDAALRKQGRASTVLSS